MFEKLTRMEMFVKEIQYQILDLDKITWVEFNIYLTNNHIKYE